eukprot:272217_1
MAIYCHIRSLIVLLSLVFATTAQKNAPIEPYYTVVPETDIPTYRSCSCGDVGSVQLPCSGFYRYYSRACYSFFCAINHDAHSTISAYLEKIVQGQAEAIRRIVNDLWRHIEGVINQTDNRSPCVLHLAGDNGVGKTLAASVVARFLFQMHNYEDPVSQHGTLLLSGSFYQAPQLKTAPEDAETWNRKQKQLLRNQIFAQLRKCSNSIIIVNDLEKMDANVFSSLEDFFEGIAYDEATDQRISTKDATFILTSDLGSGELTRGWSADKLEFEIRKRFELYVNKNRKLLGLVVHIPFRSLSVDEMSKIIRKELSSSLTCGKRFNCVEFTHDVVTFLADKWWTSPTYRSMNGRAVDKILLNRFVHPVARNAIPPSPGRQTLILQMGTDSNGDRAVIASARTHIYSGSRDNDDL